ncbi:MAG: beta-lactamase family protein [candidate division Zixibacteria bacterium]|nr:beta-lactamase family protein [candidate division Zixibacteria bacterium]
MIKARRVVAAGQTGRNIMNPRIYICLFVLVAAISILFACNNDKPAELSDRISSFEQRLEKWRTDLKIPAFSAGIVKDKDLIWAKGFGLADIENNIAATESTTYHLASLTKTFASIIVMQLVEEKLINPHDSISKYGISLDEAREQGLDVGSEDEITVINLLTHTAQGEPGTNYLYSGYLFGLLDQVIESASGKTFGELVVERIILPLDMKNTAPNIKDTLSFAFTGYDYGSFYANMAKPYALDSLGNIEQSELEGYFGAAAGLMSSVADMAKYSNAIDDRRFLSFRIWDKIFTQTVSQRGESLPYGTGWFVQYLNDMKIVWHYGLWNTNSSLIIKVPEKSLTFIILANSNELNNGFGLGNGDIFGSLFGVEFIKSFALTDEKIIDIDYDRSFMDLKQRLKNRQRSNYDDLYPKELFVRALLSMKMGDRAKWEKLYKVYNDVFAKQLPSKFDKMKLIAQIDSVQNDQVLQTEFEIHELTEVQIYAIGEGANGEMWDYGWITDASSDEIIWKMEAKHTEPAGGDNKNRVADTRTILKPGKYKLNYKADGSHAFLQWNTLPPEIAFYGIALYVLK